MSDESQQNENQEITNTFAEQTIELHVEQNKNKIIAYLEKFLSTKNLTLFHVIFFSPVILAIIILIIGMGRFTFDKILSSSSAIHSVVLTTNAIVLLGSIIIFNLFIAKLISTDKSSFKELNAKWYLKSWIGYTTALIPIPIFFFVYNIIYSWKRISSSKSYIKLFGINLKKYYAFIPVVIFGCLMCVHDMCFTVAKVTDDNVCKLNRTLLWDRMNYSVSNKGIDFDSFYDIKRTECNVESIKELSSDDVIALENNMGKRKQKVRHHLLSADKIMKELFNVDLVNFYDEKGFELIDKTTTLDTIANIGSTNEHLLAHSQHFLANNLHLVANNLYVLIDEISKYDSSFSKDRNFKFKSGTRLFEARTKLSIDEINTCANQIIVLEDNVMYIISEKGCN